MECLRLAGPTTGFRPSPAQDGEGDSQMPSPSSQPKLYLPDNASHCWSGWEAGCPGPQADFTNVETEVPGRHQTCLRLHSEVAKVQGQIGVSPGRWLRGKTDLMLPKCVPIFPTPNQFFLLEDSDGSSTSQGHPGASP